MDFAVPTYHRIELKQDEKKYKYQDLDREFKKTVEHECEILAGASSTVTKVLLKELEVMKINGQVETIQTTTLLRTARILRRVLETWGDLLSLKLLWNTNC